jgi:hypothetical protein
MVDVVVGWPVDVADSDVAVPGAGVKLAPAEGRAERVPATMVATRSSCDIGTLRVQDVMSRKSVTTAMVGF